MVPLRNVNDQRSMEAQLGSSTCRRGPHLPHQGRGEPPAPPSTSPAPSSRAIAHIPTAACRCSVPHWLSAFLQQRHRHLPFPMQNKSILWRRLSSCSGGAAATCTRCRLTTNSASMHQQQVTPAQPGSLAAAPMHVGHSPSPALAVHCHSHKRRMGMPHALTMLTCTHGPFYMQARGIRRQRCPGLTTQQARWT